MSELSAKKAHVAAAKNTRDHGCHATGCTIKVKPAYFMCQKHWRMVPGDLQAKVWATYQPGQEEGAATPTRTYLDITDAAIKAVAEKEGR